MDERFRADALEILRAGIAAAEPYAAVRRALRLEDGAVRVGEERIDLPYVGRVWLVGAGKAAAGMARAVVDVLGARVAGGAVTAPDGAAPGPLGRVETWEAAHPVPDTRGLAG
ncbi:MAG TPA: DUF4147 domain-containing protein, partial [Longimicrobiaceae bacterium]|nr:DUF4147 domain-containing protein [Longimicrobiaceae bacterium]